MLDRLNTLLIGAHARFATFDLRREEGQTLAEYALILALVAVAAVTVLGLLAGGITSKLTSICSSIKGSAC